MFFLLLTRASCAHGSFPPKMRAETTHLIPICQITFADAAAHDLLAKTVAFSDCKSELRNVALHLAMLKGDWETKMPSVNTTITCFASRGN